MKNKYGALASLVYELDKPVGVSFGDVEYYLARLQHVNGLILEPGVGNGRFLIPLLKAGQNVTGIDNSEFMLDHARSALLKHEVSASLVLSSFHAYQTDERYDAIVMPAGSFQLIDSFESAIELLAHFRTLLNEKGRLFIDIDPAHSIFLGEPSVRKWDLSPTACITLSTKRLAIDYAAQVITELHRYELWEEGVLQKTELEEFSLRWWGANELALAFEAAGFTDTVISGGYEFRQPPCNGDCIISVEGIKKS